MRIIRFHVKHLLKNRGEHSAPQFADTLFINLGTVKNDVSSIYSKLDTSDPVQAVAAAQTAPEDISLQGLLHASYFMLQSFK